MLLAGTIVALVPIKDYRHIYSDVFEQQEPEVREAMAAAVLKNMADDGKRGRVNGAIFWYAMPVIELSASLVGGLLTGDDRWQSSVAGHLSSLGFGALFGTLNLLQKSEAELRYERYLDVREQYYANKH